MTTFSINWHYVFDGVFLLIALFCFTVCIGAAAAFAASRRKQTAKAGAPKTSPRLAAPDPAEEPAAKGESALVEPDLEAAATKAAQDAVDRVQAAHDRLAKTQQALAKASAIAAVK